MPKTQIQAIAAQLEIPYLVHFTRATNLEHIFAHGIYPISRTNEIGVAPAINDALRLDRRCDGTSTSIAFPNCQMLYKYRMDNQSVEWAILVLEPSILWVKDCAFCKHNAADARISGQPLQALRTAQAFQELFHEIEGIVPRAEQNLKPFDPTDVQAEVLVFDVIEPGLIAGVVFDSAATKTKYSATIGDRKTWVHANNKGLFASRNYARKFA